MNRMPGLGWGACGCLLASAVAAANTFLQDGLMLERLDRVPRPEEAAVAPAAPLDFLRQPAPVSREPAPGLGPDVTDPDPVVAAHRLAAARYAEAQRWDAVVREYQALFRLVPPAGTDVERAALAASLAGQYSLADTYFETVLQEQPDRVDYWIAWGAALIRLQRWAEADRAFAGALERNPASQRAHFYRLVLDHLQSRAPRDIEFWVDQPFAALIQAMNLMLEDESVWRDGLGPELQQAVAGHLIGPVEPAELNGVRNILLEAHASLRAQEWDQALTSLEQAREKGATHPMMGVEHARASYYAGDTETAVQQVSNLAEAHPDARWIRYAHVYLLINEARYADALEQTRDMLERFPGDPPIQFAHISALAGLGELDLAWPLLEALARIHPDLLSPSLQGHAPYVEIIRADDRYPALRATLGLD